jgi:Zn-dependent protease
MPKVYPFGRLAGLQISARASTIPAFILVWAGLSGVGHFLLHLDWTAALIGGLAAACLHYVSELWHQLGHAIAARRSGHPMKGIQFWGALSTSLYPLDEGELPKQVHIFRALGGPLGSLILSLLTGLLALATYSAGSAAGWVLAFLFLDNLLLLTLGALLPLGFTDGSTLLKWIRA